MIYCYGKHSIQEAVWSQPKSIKKLYIAGHLLDEDVAKLAKKKGLHVGNLDASKLPGGLRDDVNHQGYVAQIDENMIVKPYKEFIEGFEVDSNTTVAILGELTDPQNVGAIIRSAAAFGVDAIMLPQHKQSPVTGAVAKVSAGMVFKVPIVQISNVNTTIADLKDKGFWIYGLDGSGDKNLPEEGFEKASAIIIGSEGKGLREKTREHCDFVLSIPMDERCESLNAATAAAVVFYEMNKS